MRGPGEDYLSELEASLQGTRAAKERLLAELRDHIDDTVAAIGDVEEGERQAVAQLGAPAAVAAAWAGRCGRLRRRRRRRVASIAAAVAAASMLAVAQHADGRRAPADPVRPCAAASSSANVVSSHHKARASCRLDGP